jgi:hypothetical protein
VILGVGQRRGADVKLPKIGSRVGELCFGGIYGFYAVLRREFNWRNLDLTFFEVLFGSPRGDTEEGGPLGVHSVSLGELFVLRGGGFVRSFNALRGDL